jgi:hypothetical protein
LIDTLLEINCTKIVELNHTTKEMSRDEHEIKSSECLVDEAHGIGRASKLWLTSQ